MSLTPENQPTPHTESSLFCVAAALIVGFGHHDPRDFNAGTDESDWFIFTAKDGTHYSLEFGGVDYDFPVTAYRGDAEKHWAAFTDDDAEELEGEALYAHVDKVQPLDEIWSLKLDRTDLEKAEHVITGLGPDEHPYQKYSLITYQWAIGALATFLYDLREGKVSNV